MNVPAFQPVPLRLPLSAVAALADVMARIVVTRARQQAGAQPLSGYGFRLRARTTAARLRAALCRSSPVTQMR